MGTTDAEKNIGISFPALLNNEVAYFESKTLVIQITNRWSEPIVIEDLTLKFQADSGGAYVHQKIGQKLSPDAMVDVSMTVTPGAQFAPHTNYFSVALHYRREVKGQLTDEPLRASRPNVDFLIIRIPSEALCGAFISFKQPEDLVLARMMEKFARRAGFEPYIVVNDPSPGGDQWERIERDIQRSKIGFVLWTANTEWGDGVQREIELCRTYGVTVVPVIAEDTAVPALFERNKERVRFNMDVPADGLIVAAEKTRNTAKRLS